MKWITRQDVLDCYQGLLGRQPESDAVVATHLRAASNYWQLVRIFLASDEYQSRLRRLSETVRGRTEFIPAGHAHNVVQTSVDDGQLSDCLARVKDVWTRLGQERAHHSVLTADEYLPDRLDQNLTGFWTTGDEEVDDAVLVLQRYLALPLEHLVLNELGCGVGRVSIPFSRRVQKVRGYDISAAHLTVAGARATAERTRNIEFIELGAGTLPAFERCDVFYSRIVLQHNPPPVIIKLLEHMLRSLRPGGVAIFQVPSYIEGYSFRLATWMEATGFGMEMHAVPMDVLFDLVTQQRCAVREVREDGATGSGRMISNTFVVQMRSA